MPHHQLRRHALPEIEEMAPAYGARTDGEIPANRCPNCRWVDAAPGGYICRRHPPVVNQHRPGEAYYPRVKADDWCGEFSQ